MYRTIHIRGCKFFILKYADADMDVDVPYVFLSLFNQTSLNIQHILIDTMRFLGSIQTYYWTKLLDAFPRRALF